MQVCQAWWCIRRRTSCSTFQGRRLCRCGGVALVSQSRSASIFLCSRSMQSFESQVRFSRPRFWHIWEILQRQVQVSFIKNPLLKSEFSAKKIGIFNTENVMIKWLGVTGKYWFSPPTLCSKQHRLILKRIGWNFEIAWNIGSVPYQKFWFLRII